jgi:uncharacterized membrane protein
MSYLIVITFDSPSRAHEVRLEMKKLQEEDLLSLEDSSVIAKDEHGKVHVIDETGNTVKAGAVIGGMVGLFVAVLFPVAGIIAGALGGALIGRALDNGVDAGFVKEVSAALEPGHSALFLQINHANANAVLAALKPYDGKVYQTNLTPELEDALRDALERHHAGIQEIP